MSANALNRTTKLYLTTLLPVQISGHYWVNILAEASIYQSLSPAKLDLFNVTQQKSNQTQHGQNDLDMETVLFPSSNITACAHATTQKNKQFTPPIRAPVMVKPYE